MSFTIPNLRKIFIPDAQHVIYDADLVGADAQVVAWDADDADLKAAFRAGLDVHSYNAETMLGEQFTRLSPDDPHRAKLRKQQKQGVHSTNYGVSVRTLSQILGWTQHETDLWQRRWFGAHPKIKAWHTKVEMSLRTTRSVSNAFGYTITYFDRIDALLPQALAWIPQSTVAIVCFKGALACRKHIPNFKLLLNNHDSNVFQIPNAEIRTQLPEVERRLHITVPYDDPLTIPWELASSTVSWGDCKSRPWPSQLQMEVTTK